MHGKHGGNAAERRSYCARGAAAMQVGWLHGVQK
eukprot:CAMPEP_0206466066 /NCGR_PEP_ID=MMETSP0324_2-20121206/28227_1 /ASSEMBLY_ACC=CAM_ASM_000836 /TAXON_ID=2866 /ORGANISM="Crypthecodinium cohnii, Strain Seligo" /LENGTH=33 /DNA_ID= /DNA_START= /DNA_END= /DNA_ORIENTATION=